MSVLYQAAILDFCKVKHEKDLKLKKKTWNEFSVKKLSEKEYYKGIYVKFLVCYNFFMASGGHFGFSQKNMFRSWGTLGLLTGHSGWPSK